jgi:hypothetical protein
MAYEKVKAHNDPIVTLACELAPPISDAPHQANLSLRQESSHGGVHINTIVDYGEEGTPRRVSVYAPDGTYYGLDLENKTLQFASPWLARAEIDQDGELKYGFGIKELGMYTMMAMALRERQDSTDTASLR